MLCQVQGAASLLDYLRIGLFRPALNPPRVPGLREPLGGRVPGLAGRGAAEDAPRVCLTCCPPQPPAPPRPTPVGRVGYNGGVATDPHAGPGVSPASSDG